MRARGDSLADYRRLRAVARPSDPYIHSMFVPGGGGVSQHTRREDAEQVSDWSRTTSDIDEGTGRSYDIDARTAESPTDAAHTAILVTSYSHE